MNYLIVFLGGGLGAAARYGMNIGVARVAGSAFPWHTMVINITGCFIMGALTELMAPRLNISNEMRLFLTTGILGGYTTFSAFALDFALLMERRDAAGAAAYVLASVGLSLIACFIGLWLVRTLAA
ncbi:MAG: fluoride efflux transporter CrcB [Alphaproteobacteria bacterium]|nr:fluoride efflux transporter CrcB [Alphaproteobacteria bacterium]